MTFQRQMIDSGVRVINDNYVEWRSCLRKKRHVRYSDAEQTALRYGHGHPYYCENCFGFHVGGADMKMEVTG